VFEVQPTSPVQGVELPVVFEVQPTSPVQGVELPVVFEVQPTSPVQGVELPVVFEVQPTSPVQGVELPVVFEVQPTSPVQGVAHAGVAAAMPGIAARASNTVSASAHASNFEVIRRHSSALRPPVRRLDLRGTAPINGASPSTPTAGTPQTAMRYLSATLVAPHDPCPSA